MWKNWSFTFLIFLTIFSSAIAQRNGAKISFGIEENRTDHPDTLYQKLYGNTLGLDAHFGGDHVYLEVGAHLQTLNLPDLIFKEEKGRYPRAFFLKIPGGVGLQVGKIQKFIFRVKGGLALQILGQIEENNKQFFKELNEMKISTYLEVGINIMQLTIDFRKEDGLNNLFTNIDSKSSIYSLAIGVFL